MEENLRYRMYGFVLYSLSQIQKGIQYGHAVVEYSLKNFDDSDFQSWATNDKTFIVLDGGTSNDTSLGTLQMHISFLNDLSIKSCVFREPDFNNTLTAVCFLLDERVWDKEKYPDYKGEYLKMRDGGLIPKDLDDYAAYVDSIGVTAVKMRYFLKDFKLAS